MKKSKYLEAINPPISSMADLDQSLASNLPDVFRKITGGVQTATECASSIGVIVSLIDGIIAQSRVLWGLDLSSFEAQEALKDMASTSELKMLMATELEYPAGRILASAKASEEKSA